VFCSRQVCLKLKPRCYSTLIASASSVYPNTSIKDTVHWSSHSLPNIIICKQVWCHRIHQQRHITHKSTSLTHKRSTIVEYRTHMFIESAMLIHLRVNIVFHNILVPYFIVEYSFVSFYSIFTCRRCILVLICRNLKMNTYTYIETLKWHHEMINNLITRLIKTQIQVLKKENTNACNNTSIMQEQKKTSLTKNGTQYSNSTHGQSLQ